MKRTTLRFKRGACLLYTGAMILTSVIPMETRTDSAPFWAALEPSLQNLLHIPMFAGFVILFHWSLPPASACRRSSLVPTLGVAAALGILMEGIQVAVPGRYPSWGDIALNLFGAGLGIFFLLWGQRKRAVEGKT